MANEVPWTAGPWRIADGGGSWDVETDDEYVVMDIDYKSDALLIAAAPELYHALAALLPIAERNERGVETERARAALRKALGEFA